MWMLLDETWSWKCSVEVSLRPPSEKCGMGIVGCTILEFRVEMRPLTESPGTLYTLLLKSCIEFYFF